MLSIACGDDRNCGIRHVGRRGERRREQPLEVIEREDDRGTREAQEYQFLLEIPLYEKVELLVHLAAHRHGKFINVSRTDPSVVPP